MGDEVRADGDAIPAPRIPPRVPWVQRLEVERFAKEIDRYRRKEISDDEFRAFRLENGVYGIRFHPDVQMVRVKVPLGRLTADQLEVLEAIAHGYARDLGHVTTRQDVQFHWVPLERIPDLLADLAAVGLTTREACGNTVRNVTACPEAGVHPQEPFDVTPYAQALSAHFLRNPLCQNLPRKFKVAFSGCPEDCAMTAIHDLGFLARVRELDGREVRGFEVYVGGGLGSAPKPAQLLRDFVSVEDYLNLTEAILRIFDRRGERERRHRARLKFLVGDLGIERFRALVAQELRLVRQTRPGARAAEVEAEEALPPRVSDPPAWTPAPGEGFGTWLRTNVKPQKQPGYYMVYIALPAGDLMAAQFRGIADLSRRYGEGAVRTTLTQNLLLRWVRAEALPALHGELTVLGLARPGVHGIGSVVGCPGADTCNLAITTSHRLAQVLLGELEGSRARWPQGDLQDVTIKVSGCPNSCGQHHVASIGLYGGSRRAGDRAVPFYHILLGGRISPGEVKFGRLVAKVPARNAPAAVVRIIDLYLSRRIGGEGFTSWVEREEAMVAVADGGTSGGKHGDDGEAGVSPLATLVGTCLGDLETVPDYGDKPEFYKDWGQDTDFKLKVGRGECAGPSP